MSLSTISQWLAHIGKVHPAQIELGLDRVKKVAGELDLLAPKSPVIIVGGTNGKGSTVAGLEAIYRAAHYRVGVFTSPILFKHNEQVRINGEFASDEAFCQAFALIEKARGDVLLTPFEFHTLAALIIFKSYPLDLLILEVGLGGRLDAVNILDADLAIVTSISIDHTEYLGHTREAIAYEKAGIFRSQRPVVCGDDDPPLTMVNHAEKISASLYYQGKDFHYQEHETFWSWQSANHHYDHLPYNVLATQNMATVIMAITLLQNRLPVSEKDLSTGLSKAQATGRIQIVPGEITHIYDVSHNVASVALLAKRLQKMPQDGKNYAVFSMLSDKDISESIKQIASFIDDWFIAPLNEKRAASEERLMTAFQEAKINNTHYAASIELAYETALKTAKKGDRIIIFGSFHTVAAIINFKKPS